MVRRVWFSGERRSNFIQNMVDDAYKKYVNRGRREITTDIVRILNSKKSSYPNFEQMIMAYSRSLREDVMNDLKRKYGNED